MTDGGRGRRWIAWMRAGIGSVLAAALALATVGSLVAAPSAGAAAPKSNSAATVGSSDSPGPKVNAALLASTAPPSIPFITGAVPEGLALLVNWNPNPTTDNVTGYKLTAAVATGFAAKVSKKCASPTALAAPSTDTSALIPKLCAGVPYVVTMNRPGIPGGS